MEIGSNISPDPGMYTIYYTPMEYENNMDDEDASIGIQDDDHMIYVIYEGTLSWDIYLDEIVVNTTHARQF